MATDNASDSITVHVTHMVKPECKEGFLKWGQRINETARKFEGFEGGMVFPPGETQQGHHAVFRFSSIAMLHEFWDSEEYQQHRKELDELVSEPSVFRYENGLEHWFVPPNETTASPPSTHKMAVVVFLSILPLIWILPPLMHGALSMLPGWASQIITTAFMVIIMSYVAMPLMTRILSFWLFPGK